MSDFDKLKDEGEQYAKDHPQQMHEAEQDAENALKSKFGPDGAQQQGDQQQPDDHDPDAGQQGQGQQSQQEDGQQGRNG